ncbi:MULTISPECIES: hypothetical protein [unclassified Moorena]|uniref:hypothetical protein n=1 Tax=unclassified Moorena TaxID=2683338 RepID=UPI0013FF8006|nr:MULTISPECIES: hypothetical protein [unclassified Moorena]NEO12610.1 hypothetical protein [Moorena sp. SIO3E8]NEP97760.1 hypothetical protein [Moorena sp. SIO3F7]
MAFSADLTFITPHTSHTSHTSHTPLSFPIPDSRFSIPDSPEMADLLCVTRVAWP